MGSSGIEFVARGCRRRLESSHRMELRHLRYFVAVAEESNFTRAAARLHLTQPALSRQIRGLEEELGVELMIRDSGKATLSPAGRALLPDARRILELSAAAALNLRRFVECRQHALGIGYISTALNSFLATGLQVFNQRHPQVRVSLYELSPGKQFEALREGRLDIALVGNVCPAESQEFDLFSIRKVPVCAVLPETHRLAAKRGVQLAELAHEPFIGFAEDTFPGRNEFLRDACRQAGFTPDIRQEADGLSSALALIGTGLGVCLMPEEVQSLSHRHSVFLPLQKPKVHVEFSAAVASGEKRPVVRTMLEEFRAAAIRDSGTLIRASRTES